MSDEEKTKTIIELEDDEVAFIMDSDKNVQLHIPKMDDEDNVPEHVQFMSAISVVCTTDVEVIELIWKKFYEFADKERVN